jgi:hypothetical protein
LKEEDTELILVVPYMGEDLNRYYKDIIGKQVSIRFFMSPNMLNVTNLPFFQANGLPEKNPIWVGRLHFVVPETAKFYRKPQGADTESAVKLPEMLLTSHKALKLISLICEKKPAVVFVDQVGDAEVSLSAVIYKQKYELKCSVLNLNGV